MERLSPFELDQLSASPAAEVAPSPPDLLQLSSSPAGPYTSSFLSGTAQRRPNMKEAEEDLTVADVVGDDEDEEEEDEEENRGSGDGNDTSRMMRSPILIASDFSINGGDDDELLHSETERLLDEGRGPRDDNPSTSSSSLPSSSYDEGMDEHFREPSTSLDPAFTGEDGMRLSDLRTATPSSTKKKRVSWVDEEEKGRGSVVFGAVTAVFVAPSPAEYDRTPSAGYLRRRSRRMHRRQRVMLALFVLIFFLIISGLLALLIMLLTGHLAHSSSSSRSS